MVVNGDGGDGWRRSRDGFVCVSLVGELMAADGLRCSFGARQAAIGPSVAAVGGLPANLESACHFCALLAGSLIRSLSEPRSVRLLSFSDSPLKRESKSKLA